MGATRTIGLLTVLNIVGAGLGVVTSIVTAQFFGTSRALEIFFAASALEVLVAKLTQTGVLTDVFLPIYHQIKQKRGREAAGAGFSVLTNWTVLVSTGLCGVAMLAAPVLARLMVPGFGVEDQIRTCAMFRALAPLLVVQALGAMLVCLTNAERMFGRPELLGLVSRVLSLASLVALARPLGTWAMVVSLWVNSLVGLSSMLWLVARHGYRHSLRLRSREFSMWILCRQLMSTWTYVGANQLCAFVFNAAISLLPQGIYAVFNYVQQLYTKTFSVFVRPVSVVFFTHFSEAFAAGAKDVRELVRRTLDDCVGLGALLIGMVALCGLPALNALWGSKKFGVDQLDLAAWLLLGNYVLVLPMSDGLIMRKVCMAVGLIGRSYTVSSLAILVYAALIWWCVRHWGIWGAVVGSVIGQTLVNAGFSISVHIWRRDFAVTFSLSEAWRWFVAAFAGFVTGKAALLMMGSTASMSRVGHALLAALLAGVFLGTSVPVAALLGIRRARHFVRTVATHLAGRQRARLV